MVKVSVRVWFYHSTFPRPGFLGRPQETTAKLFVD